MENECVILAYTQCQFLRWIYEELRRIEEYYVFYDKLCIYKEDTFNKQPVICFRLYIATGV